MSNEQRFVLIRGSVTLWMNWKFGAVELGNQKFEDIAHQLHVEDVGCYLPLISAFADTDFSVVEYLTLDITMRFSIFDFTFAMLRHSIIQFHNLILFLHFDLHTRVQYERSRY